MSDFIGELSNAFGLIEFSVSITQGLAGNFITAGIIAPILGILILRWRRRRWRRFREYLAALVEQNHTDLQSSMKQTIEYLTKIAEFSPQQVKDIDEVEFERNKTMLYDAVETMEGIGTKFHFAMEPTMLEAWARYHAECWKVLRDPNRITWKNAEGIVSAIKRGYTGFENNFPMFDDVYTGPMRRATAQIKKIDLSSMNSLKSRFVQTLSS